MGSGGSVDIVKQVEGATDAELGKALGELSAEQRAKIAEALTGPKGKFFAIYHSFKSKEASETWWKMMGEMKPEEQAKLQQEWEASGYKNHFFMPEGGEKPTLCVWETKNETSLADFQAFIDSEKGPGQGKIFNNRVTLAAPGASTPNSFFEKGAGDEPKPTTGSWFWIDHTFKSKEASDTWWKMMVEMKPEEQAKMQQEWEASGFKNHFFMPEGGMGQTICIWETKTDTTTEDFQTFIDGEKGPGGGKVFNNEVHKVMAGGSCPSASFAA